MEVLRLTNKNEEEILLETERILRSGKISIVPTDTVYGIVGDATRERVVQRIFVLKQRPPEKAFPVFVKDIPSARYFAYISDKKAKFLGKVWPGPVTVIFRNKEKLPKNLTQPISLRDMAGQAGGKGMIGIRIPNHSFLLKLLSRLDFPLAQTSANISGKPPARNIGDIKRYFEEAEVEPDLIIDAGELSGRSSTVADFTGKEPVVLRTGLVSKEELDRILTETK